MGLGGASAIRAGAGGPTDAMGTVGAMVTTVSTPLPGRTQSTYTFIAPPWRMVWTTVPPVTP